MTSNDCTNCISLNAQCLELKEVINRTTKIDTLLEIVFRDKVD